MVFVTRLLMADICKQSLLALRKATGHSFQHCKKALESSNNNVQEATKWLEAESLKQGWSKLERTAARVTKEGVLGTAASDNVVAVTELNCETDFVARNAELRGFAAKVSQSLCGEFTNKTSVGLKMLTWGDISKMIFDHQTAEESRAKLVARVGENLNLRRSMVISPPDGEKVAVSCHPDGVFGRYGAAVFYKGGDVDLAEKLCRHIVGMRPSAIGCEADIIKAKKAKEEAKKAREEAKLKAQEAKEAEAKEQESLKATASSEGAQIEEQTEEADKDEQPEEADEDEPELLILQDFVFDQDKKVAEVLRENNMQVTKFWRFECGEELQESKVQQ